MLTRSFYTRLDVFAFPLRSLLIEFGNLPLTYGRKCASSWGRSCLTTAYHDAANGMVERSYRTVKKALMCNDNPTAWYQNLGLVLLGIHSMVKEDIGCSSSELTLGTTLRLPRKFFSDNDKTVSLTEYRRRLLAFIKSLKPSLPRKPCRRSSYVEKALRTCTHVFVRDDGSATSLQLAYT